MQPIQFSYTLGGSEGRGNASEGDKTNGNLHCVFGIKSSNKVEELKRERQSKIIIIFYVRKYEK